MKKTVTVLGMLFSLNAFSAQLCGKVEIVRPKRGTAAMAAYWLHVPNRAIPESGFKTTYRLLDDNRPVLRGLVNGAYQCVIGVESRDFNEPTFVVTAIRE